MAAMTSPRRPIADPMPDIPGPDPDPRPPGFALPAGAWDTHFHVIDRATGLVPERSYTPPDAPRDRLMALHGALGIARGVFVQVSVHGTDNRAMLAALRATPGYRGVAVVDATVTDAELEAMHAAGVRGTRVNLLFGGGVGFAVGAALAPRIAPLGWHVQLLIDASAPDVPWADLARWPVPLVVDHMGHMPVARSSNDPGFQRLLGLVRDGKAWVKLSGAERISAATAPPYDDVVAHARTLLEAGPDRCVWGSDWPHVMLPGAMPKDGDLLDQLARWAPEEGLRRKILVDNPARLYGG
jgi:2-pyrone-4,6-dicarboxylate lactonase